ncbi:MAG: ATPase, T2SS/T4P/T4SS family [Hyphomonas sp.]|uniref:ATPase, T2SS/T4P/T4SS family n=1 Tax=Hyphomonas sp. TaxID=87 RepID=UPI003298D9AA
MIPQIDTLRVFNSRGQLRDNAIPLDQSLFELGNDSSRALEDPGYISLNGSGISARHARLQRSGKTWHIEVLGEGKVRLGQDQLQRGETRLVEHGRDLWVGSAYLNLIYWDMNTAAQTSSGGLHDLEHTLSLNLLDFEERNRGLFESSGPENREALLSVELDRLINENLDQLESGTLFIYTREALRRLLVARCLTSGSPGDVTLNYTQLNADQLRQSQSIRQQYIVELGLQIEPDATASDIQLVQENISAVHDQLGSNIPEYMQRLLIRDSAREAVLGLIFQLGSIQFLLDTPNINEIMISGSSSVFVEKGGQMFDTGLPFRSEQVLRRIAEVITSRDGKQLNQNDTMVDARLPDGSRANVVIAPTAHKGTAITIRKFSTRPISMDDMVKSETLSEEMLIFLKACVRARRNILVSGGTGTGKTTLLNGLSKFIDDSERVITIEDTAELKLEVPNLVSMEGRPANAEGIGEISVRQMLRNALRMRPDRIVVGECRGGETLDMLQAMNTGHEGSMTTAHANSPQDLLLRLETMVAQSGVKIPVSAIRQQIAAALDLVVQVRRVPDRSQPEDGKIQFSRKITEICEVGEYDADTGEIAIFPIFEFVSDTQTPRFSVSGYIPSFFDGLVARKYINISALFPSGDRL